MRSEDLVWGQCFGQKTVLRPGVLEIYKRKLGKHNVPKFFMVCLQTNLSWMVLTVICLNLFAKHRF